MCSPASAKQQQLSHCLFRGLLLATGLYATIFIFNGLNPTHVKLELSLWLIIQQVMEPGAGVEE
jgi:hypothetical protein